MRILFGFLCYKYRAGDFNQVARMGYGRLMKTAALCASNGRKQDLCMGDARYLI